MRKIIYILAIVLFSSFSYSQVIQTNYTYDNQNRLIKVIYNNDDIVEYEYDALGNRIQKEYIDTQLTYVPDDNFEQALIDLGYDSGALDDYVPTNNINTVTYLNINNKSISDLTGLQDFISLDYLECSNNNLTTINLENCTNLIEIAFDENYLTTLDISNNANLQSISCVNNQITHIDFANNIQLQALNCYNNNMLTIDVSNLSNLHYLNVSHNNLTSLDLSQNHMLITLQCSFNNLSELNINNGNNTSLSTMEAVSNNLTCIQVDDVNYANSQICNTYGPGWCKDANTVYSEDCSAGINDSYLSQYISINPNPTSSIIYIDNPLNIKFVQIKISNVLGQTVYSSLIVKDKIDISNFSNGTYLMELKDENNRKVVYKIIKK